MLRSAATLTTSPSMCGVLLTLNAENKMDIRPGMPVELFVKTGERTMMNYLLKPLVDRAQSSMSED